MAAARREENPLADAEEQQFPDKLNALMASRGNITQQAIADHLGLTRASVNDWCRGRAVPAADTVFALEAALGVEAGELSRTLGYLPLSFDHPADRLTVVEAIALDSRLDDQARRMLTMIYEEFVTEDPPRPKKK